MEYICKDERLKIKPNKKAVLAALGCGQGSVIYDDMEKELSRLYGRLCAALDTRCTAVSDGKYIYVTITAGAEIGSLSAELFAGGAGLAGLLANAAADEAVFSADTAAAERIKYYCAKTGTGIKRRLAAPEDMPISEQALILEKAPVTGVSINGAFVLCPEKSMAYKLELTDDAALFAAQHDCSRCPNKSCPRRSAAYGGFEILSDFEYTPKTASGVAVDIGTTTIAVMRLEDGAVKERAAELNAQRRFGADVLSRLEAAQRGRGAELSAAIDYQIKKLVRAVGGEGMRTVVSANTTMSCLYLGMDCSKMGCYPFTAPCLDTVTRGSVTVTGGISAFVGGDITSGLYMCGFDRADEINLLIDLGTNGEMAIGNRDKILCTSAAAGPAFEGGGISCGTGSVEGAVCAVDLRGNKIETIGGRPPHGICGTGIIELVSELLDGGLCDETGLIADGEIEIAPGVTFTQRDMRCVQTAKAAVRAGIELLIAEYGAAERDIAHVYIAGGFGRRLNVKKACRIGLIPPRLAAKCRAVGNSSLGGSVKLLENPNGFADIERIRAAAREFSLAENAKFNDLFIKYMNYERKVL